jgi:NADH-quinone oxidoreductase subunit H
MSAPSFVTAQFIVSAVTIVLMVHVILVTCAYMIYLERKISAYIQDRIGPNRVGFDFGQPWLSGLKGCLGLGQSLADGLKFLLKEDYMPSRVDKVLFTLAPAIIIIPALIGFIIIPWGGKFLCPSFTIPLLDWHIAGGPVNVAGASFSVGVLYLLAVGSLGVYGVTLGGWASNNKFSFLGAMRATAQMISYEIPLGLSLMAALLLMGTVVPSQIVQYQVSQGWLVFAQPLGALLFFIAILAEANRAPFDNAECEQELVGGYHTEYSSMRFALFFLAEYSHMVTSSALFVLLFFGGYSLHFLPFVPEIPLLSPESMGIFAVLAKFIVFFSKAVLVIAFMMVIRWTIPRLRFDQIMMMAWQQVIPLALALVVTVSVMVYMGQTSLVAMLVANIGLIAVTVLIQPLIPKPTSNRKLALFGSRFSAMPGEVVHTGPREAIAIADHPVHGTAVHVKG